MRRCRLSATHQTARPGRWDGMRETFITAISHPDLLLEARKLANEPGSDLILDNLTAPPHPSFGGGFGGTLLDRLADLDGTPERIEAETADDRTVDVTYWADVSDEQERNIVGNLAYWSACWATKSPMPTGGGVEWAPAEPTGKS